MKFRLLVLTLANSAQKPDNSLNPLEPNTNGSMLTKTLKKEKNFPFTTNGTLSQEFSLTKNSWEDTLI